MDISINCGLWLIMMYQCCFLYCNKCTAQVQDVDGGGGCELQVVECQNSILFTQFYYEIKTALKKSIVFLMKH